MALPDDSNAPATVAGRRRKESIILVCSALVVVFACGVPAVHVLWVVVSLGSMSEPDGCVPVDSQLAQAMNTSPVVVTLPSNAAVIRTMDFPRCQGSGGSVGIVLTGTASDAGAYTEHYRAVVIRDGWTIGSPRAPGMLLCASRTLHLRTVWFTLREFDPTSYLAEIVIEVRGEGPACAPGATRPAARSGEAEPGRARG